MKTLQEIKDEVAQNKYGTKWDKVTCMSHDIMLDALCHAIHKQACEEQRKKCVKFYIEHEGLIGETPLVELKNN